MPVHSGKVENNKDNSLDVKQKVVADNTVQLISVNAEMHQMQALQEAADSSAQVQEAIQLQTIADHFLSSNTTPIQRNNTGLPDSLKHGIENLSGHKMDDVNVHYNSTRPKQLQAHAYAQGTDIHVASGQEKHLPHEAWHVAQQKQNRVKPTKQINGNVNINDDKGLEKEADVMGAKAANISNNEVVSRKVTAKSNNIIQRNPVVNEDSGPVIVNTYGMGEAIADDPRADLTEDQKEEFIKVRESKAMAFKSLNNGSLEGLANALNACSEHIVTLKDEDLVAIIQNNFESNWFKAKKCLTTDFWPGVTGTKPPHESSLLLMQALVDMRGRVWDKFVQYIQPHIRAEVEDRRARGGELANLKNPSNLDEIENEDGSKTQGNFSLGASVGSESVTSDIDLSAQGENTEIGVAMINAKFRQVYNVEPGAFFDINVYSSDWMFGAIKTSGESKDVVMSANSEAVSSTGKDLNPENQKRKDDRNEVWSMVKIRRNMTPRDWETYKGHLLEGLGDDRDSIAEMQQKFSEVDREYTTFNKTVHREAAKLSKALTHEEKQNQKNSAFAENGKDHFAEEAIEMEASNRQYEKIILRVKALRLKIQRLKDEEGTPRSEIEELLLQVHDEVSRGLTYANEVYATEGAVINTVLGDQGAKKKLKKLQAKDPTLKTLKYSLSDEQYLQAINENVGDTLHSINHNVENPSYAVYRAGKYIDRLCGAAMKLISESEAIKIPGFLRLIEIGTWSVQEKAGDAGKDPSAVKNETSYFSKVQASDLNEIKAIAIRVGAKIASLHKNKQAQEV